MRSLSGIHLAPSAEHYLALVSLCSSANQVHKPAVSKLSGANPEREDWQTQWLFFPSGVLESWRLQCRFSFNLEVRAKSLNVPLVKSWGPRSYRDSSSSRLLWQVNQNTLMLYCFPIFLCLWLAALLNQIPSFSCKKLLLLNFCQ